MTKEEIDAKTSDILARLAEQVPGLSQEQIDKLQSLMQTIEYVGIDEVHPSGNEERKNEDAIPKVAASIRELGFRSPIYTDGTGEIISGHTRFFAAKLLGMTKVPIVRVTDLSYSQIRLLKLADNKVAEFSGWDFTELNKTLDELKVELPELDLEGLGFDFDNGGEEGDKGDDDDENKKDPNFDIISVVIKCDNEQQAQETFEKLTTEGYKCAISTL